jgi:sRNA-binding carbon storage regulator CsrA
VLSVTDRRVWIGMRSPSAFPELHICATVVSPYEARLEIVPVSSVVFDADRVRITTAGDGDSASAVRAGLAVDRKPGERVEVGEDLWVAVASISKGNPSITFGGPAIGDEFSITLIRPAGSYVRLGVDAPNRRVYREELWDVVQASGGTRNGTGSSPGAVGPAPGPVETPGAEALEPTAQSPEAPVGTAVAANAAAGSVTG